VRRSSSLLLIELFLINAQRASELNPPDASQSCTQAIRPTPTASPIRPPGLRHRYRRSAP